MKMQRFLYRRNQGGKKPVLIVPVPPLGGAFLHVPALSLDDAITGHGRSHSHHHHSVQVCVCAREIAERSTSPDSPLRAITEFSWLGPSVRWPHGSASLPSLEMQNSD